MRPDITIGYLPILDHLVLGVAERNDGELFGRLGITAKRYESWDAVAEALRVGMIDGAFILTPLAMELFRQGFEGSVVLLGHREGQALTVSSGVSSVAGLRGKTVFVPHAYSTHRILLHDMLKGSGLSESDITLRLGGLEDLRQVTDLLAADEIDAFLAAEPLGTQARRRGVGQELVLSHEVRRHHIDCILLVRQGMVEEQRDLCGELVRALVRAGGFLNAYPKQGSEIGEEFLGWPHALLREALTHDRGHILFWDLLPRLEDFEALQQVAVNEMHLWPTPIDLRPYIRAEFAEEAYREWSLDLRKEIKDKGELRTLPGDFQLAAAKVRDMIGEPCLIESVGAKEERVCVRVADEGSSRIGRALRFGEGEVSFENASSIGAAMAGKGTCMLRSGTETAWYLPYSVFQLLPILLERFGSE